MMMTTTTTTTTNRFKSSPKFRVLRVVKRSHPLYWEIPVTCFADVERASRIVAPGRTFKNSRRRTLPTITEETTRQVHYEKVGNVSEVRIILPSCDQYSESSTADMIVTATSTMDHADECEEMDWESTPHDDFVDFVAEPVVISSSTATITTTTSTESVLMSGDGSPTVEGWIGLTLLDDPSSTLSDESIDFVVEAVSSPSSIATTSTTTTTTASPILTESVLISVAVDCCVELLDPSKVLSADFQPTTLLLHEDVPSPEQQVVLDVQVTNEFSDEELDQDRHSDREPFFIAIATSSLLSSSLPVEVPALRRSKRLAEIRLRQEKVGLTAVTLSTSVQVQVPELLGSIVVNGRRRSSRHFKKTV